MHLVLGAIDGTATGLQATDPRIVRGRPCPLPVSLVKRSLDVVPVSIHLSSLIGRLSGTWRAVASAPRLGVDRAVALAEREVGPGARTVLRGEPFGAGEVALRGESNAGTSQ